VPLDLKNVFVTMIMIMMIAAKLVSMPSCLICLIYEMINTVNVNLLFTNTHCYFDESDMSSVYQQNKEHHKEDAGYQNSLIPVAWAILVMGLSLAAVILLYVWIGHIGPTFSSDTLQKQQQELRQQYGLPYKPVITDPAILQTPPSERGLPGYSTNPL
jgi:hypothetical protein